MITENKNFIDTLPLLFSFISEGDQRNVDILNKRCRVARLNFIGKSFHPLINKIRNSEIIDIIFNGEINKVSLSRVLGSGGSKKAIDILNGRALIVPNMSDQRVLGNWERIVHEEVAVSRFLNSVGMLSPASQPVTIQISENNQTQCIPAYVSTTFEQLAQTNGWFIIDVRNPASSTWKENENFLFNSKTDRMNEDTWDYLLRFLLGDLAKIAKYDIPAEGDALNIAVVKAPSDSSKNPYHIRYFGFDHTSKHHPLLRIPSLSRPVKPYEIQRALNVLERILNVIFLYEFGSNRNYACGDKESGILEEKLFEKYASKLRIIIQSAQRLT